MITVLNSVSIIAPRHLHRRVLLHKPKELGVKLFTKAEVLAAFLGTYDDRQILEIAHNLRLPYETAATYAGFLPYIKKEPHGLRTRNLRDIYRTFPPLNDELDEKVFTSKKCVLYGYDKTDRELIELLNDRQVDYEIVPIALVDQYTCACYTTKVQEIGEVLNAVAQALDDGIDASDVTIVAPADYVTDLLLYSHMFNLELSYESENYLQTSAGQSLVRTFEEKTDASSVDDEVRALTEEAVSLREKGYPSALVTAYVKAVLGKVKLPRLEGVRLVTAFKEVRQAKKLVIIGFNDDLIKPHKDNDYLSDSEIESDLYRLVSYEKDAESERDLWVLLSQFPDALITFSEHGSSGDKRQPTFIDDKKMSYVAGRFNPVRYSREFDEMTFASLKEDFVKYGAVSDYYLYLQSCVEDHYDSYNPQYDGTLTPLNNLTLSASSIATYSKCPFAYYLKYILLIEEERDHFAADVGTIAHKAIEWNCGSTDERLQAFIDGFAFDVKQTFYLNQRLKSSLKMREMLKDVLTSLSGYEQLNEQRLSLRYGDHFELVGQSDLILKNESSFIVFDFKSSAKKFDRLLLYYGFDVQLLLYLKLCSRLSLTPLGAFFVPLFPKSAYNVSDSEYKYRGYFIEAALIKDLLGSDFKKTFVCSKGDSVTEPDFQKDMEYLEQVIARAAKGIRSGEYCYTPLRNKSKKALNSCLFCDYKDLCFYRKKDVRNLTLPQELAQTNEEGSEDE